MKFRKGFVTNSSSTCFLLILRNDDIRGYLDKVFLNAGKFENEIKYHAESFIRGFRSTEFNENEVNHISFRDFISDFKEKIPNMTQLSSMRHWFNYRDSYYEKEQKTWPQDEKELYRLDMLYDEWAKKICKELENEDIDFNKIIELSFEADKETSYKTHTTGFEVIREEIEYYGGVDFCNQWAKGEVDMYKIYIDYCDSLTRGIFDTLETQKIDGNKVIKIGD